MARSEPSTGSVEAGDIQVTEVGASRGYAGVRLAYFACAVAAFGGFLFGYDNGAFVSSQIFVRARFDMTAVMFGFVTSALMLGCLLATLGGMRFQERLGAARCLRIASVLFAVGALTAASAPNAWVLAMCRLISGFSTGIISISAPMYISEMSPPARRGRLGLLYQFSLTLGALMGMTAGWLLAGMLGPGLVWRVMLGSTAAPSLVLLLLSRRLPASPRWLMAHGREADAVASMLSIRDQGQSEVEIRAIRSGRNGMGGSWRELLAPGFRWALLTGVLLGLFNNWTGGTGAASYLPVLFQRAGYTSAVDALGVVLLVNCINVGITLVSIWLVEHTGRRPLWIATAATMTLTLISLGWAYHTGVAGLPIVGLTLLVVICHALGLGPIPWLMISELYSGPLRVRAVSVCTSVLWLSGFTSVLAFPPLAAWSERQTGSIGGPFWVYAAMSLLAVVFGWRLLPETKGKTLDEVAGGFCPVEIAGEKAGATTQ